MKLEEQIKQTKPFANQWERMVVNVLHTAVWLQSELSGHMERFEVTHQQYNVLRILRGQSPNAISTSDIRDRMIDRASDTSRIVDRLIARGWVEKSVCAGDRRRVDVKITKMGLELLEEIDKDNEALHVIESRLTEKEAKHLNTLLDKLKTDS